MTCPHCGAENPEGAACCSLCLKPLVEPEARGAPAPAGVEPRRGMNKALLWAVRVAAIAACVAIGWFGMDYILGRPRTFTSPGGSYSFSYPGKWKKADPSELALSGIGGADTTMEVGLADADSSSPDYIFLAGTAAAPVDWPVARNRLIEGYSQDLSSRVPGGASVSPRSFKDVTAGGRPGLSVRFSMTYRGTTYDCDLTMLGNGRSLTVLMMMGRRPNAKPDTFDRILESMKFNTK